MCTKKYLIAVPETETPKIMLNKHSKQEGDKSVKLKEENLSLLYSGAYFARSGRNLISASRRRMQEDLCEFNVSLVYTDSSRTVSST